jgi:hypothetical protein
MARGEIVFFNERLEGVYGFVLDDALKSHRGDRRYQIYFDSRCLIETETISIGDRCEFQYAATPDHNGKPKMKFETMRIIKQGE